LRLILHEYGGDPERPLDGGALKERGAALPEGEGVILRGHRKDGEVPPEIASREERRTRDGREVVAGEQGPPTVAHVPRGGRLVRFVARRALEAIEVRQGRGHSGDGLRTLPRVQGNPRVYFREATFQVRWTSGSRGSTTRSVPSRRGAGASSWRTPAASIPASSRRSCSTRLAMMRLRSSRTRSPSRGGRSRPRRHTPRKSAS